MSRKQVKRNNEFEPFRKRSEQESAEYYERAQRTSERMASRRRQAFAIGMDAVLEDSERMDAVLENLEKSEETD